VYGQGATRAVALKGGYLKGAAVVVVLCALIVSFVAERDYQANIMLGKAVRYLQVGQYGLAEATLKKSISLDFCPRQSYYYLARAQISQEKYEQALDSLEKCRSRFVDESVYLMRANVAANLGYTEAAQQDIDILLSSLPQSALASQAQYLEAMISFRNNEYSKAIDQLEELIEQYPSFERAYISLGDLYRSRGMPVTARRYLEQALDLIDKALSKARNRLSSSSSMTASEYGDLRDQIETLTQEKKVVEEALNALPGTGSP
jgi:tetratricopeptide (TPR) repeat protein